jgi:hypothetical protein
MCVFAVWTNFKRDPFIFVWILTNKWCMCEQVSASSTSTWLLAKVKVNNRRKRIEMLSRDCDGCSQMRACGRRYLVVEKGNRVFCPDGTAHLVDGL